jgi:hypothetical protein
VGQAIRLDLHRRKSVPEKGRGKKTPSFVNFRLVAPQELSDFRGDTGNMNMQLVLAAASCRIMPIVELQLLRHDSNSTVWQLESWRSQ